jgi:hypothetical protein
MELNNNNLPKRIGKWTPKLTEVAKVFAVNRLACDVPAKTIVKDIKAKFNIDITEARIRMLPLSKTLADIYANSRKKYIENLSSNAGIYIKDQLSRYKKAQEYLEDVVIDPNEEWSVKKDKIELALKLLKFAQDEEKTGNVSKALKTIPSGSLVNFVQNQQVNINKPEEQKAKVVEIGGIDEKENSNT